MLTRLKLTLSLLLMIVVTCISVGGIGYFSWETLKAGYIRVSSLAFIILFIALVSVMIIWVVNSVLFPLRKMRKTMERILDGELDSTFVAGGSSELNKIFQAYDQLRQKLKETRLSRDDLIKEIEIRRQSEATLRQSEIRNSLTLDELYHPFISIDMSGKVVKWNAKATAVFGWTQDEVMGKPLVDTIIPERLREAHMRGIDNFIKSGAGPLLNRNIQINAQHRDGHEFPIELAITPMKIKDEYFFNAVLIDMTERAHMEKLKDEFLNTVSYQLRAPMAIIKEAVENIKFLMADKLDSRQARVVDVCSKNTTQLSNMITDLLDLSRLETGKAQVSFRYVTFQTLVQDVIKMFDEAIRTKNLRMTVEIPRDLPNIFADATLLMKVLDNLIRNALEYAKSNITIKAFADHRVMHASITDDGIGISEADKKYLFDKHKQMGHTKSSRGTKGTGLGLAICKEVITLHEGQIWVESTEGQGASFHFTIPFDTKKK